MLIFNKYKYSGYDIGFDRRQIFLFPSYGVDMSYSVHVDNKKKIYFNSW